MRKHTLKCIIPLFALVLLLIHPFLAFSADSTGLSLDNETALSSNLQYINFFNIKDDDGVERYLNYIRQNYQGTYSFNDYVLGVSYQNNKLSGFANNLDSLPDRFNYQYQNKEIGLRLSRNMSSGFLSVNVSYNNYFGGGLEFRNNTYLLGIDIKPYITYLRYNIFGYAGSLPLSAYVIDLSVGFKKIKADYRRMIPLHPEENFQNKFYGDVFSLSFNNFLLRKIQLSASLLYGNIRGEMRYTNRQYGYLDHFQYINYLMKLDLPVNKNHTIFMENRAAYTWIGPDSYLEIWPFSYWSQFLSSKNKLTVAEIKLNLPGIGYQHKILYQKSKVRINNKFITSYSHILFDNKLKTADRYFVVYPVLIDYHYNSYSADINTDGIIRLQNNLELNYQNYRFGLNLIQLVPVNFNSSTGNDVSTNNEKKTGGFLISISFKFILS